MPLPPTPNTSPTPSYYPMPSYPTPYPTLDDCAIKTVTMHNKQYPSENSWVIKKLTGGFAVCQGSNYHGGIRSHSCCLAKGVSYVLECRDSYGDGWNGGYLMVGNSKKCGTGMWRKTTVVITPQSLSPPAPFPAPSNTPYPAPNPTLYPTPYPTPSPTPWPTPYPTPLPTPLPTPHPTSWPTPFPTPPPTALPAGCVIRTVTMRNKHWAYENSWKIREIGGNNTVVCSGGYSHFQNHKTIKEPCCLAAHVTYSLECLCSYGDGWHGGSLQIQNKKYCSFGRFHSKKHTFTLATP